MAVRYLLAGDRDALAEAVPSAVRALAADAVSARALVRLRDDPTAGDPRAGADPFQAVLEVAATDNSVVSTVRGIDGIDRSRSAVVCGPEFTFLAPQPDAQLVLLLAFRRPATMTVGACHRYWHDRHAPLAVTIPKLAGYTQHHARAGEAKAAAGEVRFALDDIDGVAGITFRNMTELGEVMADPAVAEQAFADERNFVDHSRSALGLFAIA